MFEQSTFINLTIVKIMFQLRFIHYSLSRLNLTRYHRRLKGFTLNSLHPAGLLSYALHCQMNPRCALTNFRRLRKQAEFVS